LSADSQVDFIVGIGEHDSGDNETMEAVTEHEQANAIDVHKDGPNGGPTLPPPPAVVHRIAGSLGTGRTGSPATAITAANTVAVTGGIIA